MGKNCFTRALFIMMLAYLAMAQFQQCNVGGCVMSACF